MAQDTPDRTHKQPIQVRLREKWHDLTQDTDREPYHRSRTRPSSCEDAELQEGGSALSKYPMGNQAGEYHRDVGDSPQLIEGEEGSILEPLCTELVDPEPTPNLPFEV